MSKVDTSKAERNDLQTWTGRVAEGTTTGTIMQNGFTLIPDKHLGLETVAGIRDMNLGRIKNGVPTGSPTIRFDTGLKSGADPHINIDPLGFSCKTNPHIPVSAETVDTAKIMGKTLKYVGVALEVAAVVVDAWRIVSAFKDDAYIRENADEIIQKLKESIEKIENAYAKENVSSKKKEEMIKVEQHLRDVLRDVELTKGGLNVKTVKTTYSAVGGFLIGGIGGKLGAVAGAEAGIWLGSLFGPIGTVVGAPIGAVLGAIGGGISAAIVGSKAAEKMAEGDLDMFVVPST